MSWEITQRGVQKMGPLPTFRACMMRHAVPIWPFDANTMYRYFSSIAFPFPIYLWNLFIYSQAVRDPLLQGL